MLVHMHKVSFKLGKPIAYSEAVEFRTDKEFVDYVRNMTDQGVIITITNINERE